MEIKETLKQITRYRHIKAWFEKYERVLLPATLVLGVILDWITFTNINYSTSFLLLGIYTFLSGIAIVFLNAFDAGRLSFENRFWRYVRLTTPFVIQFLFGALLSGVFIFYIFSGTLFVSWPFLIVLVLLMVSNDVFRHYYLKPVVQISVYFFILFSCLSVFLPFALNSLSPWVFVGSGLLALGAIFGFIALLFRLSPSLRQEKIHMAASVLTIFVFLHGLYFLNIIPPIPLSLREVVFAHDIQKNIAGYELQVEQEKWWDRLLPGQTFHKIPGEKIFLYTAIFAPKDLKTKIVHHWQWYDETKGEWVSQNRLVFDLRGGRKTGFRGYSQKSNIRAGKWRIDIETERGQVIGRVRVNVVEGGAGEMLKIER